MCVKYECVLVGMKDLFQMVVWQGHDCVCVSVCAYGLCV